MQIQSKSNPVDTASKFTAESVRQGSDSSGANFNQVLSNQIQSQSDGSNAAANIHTPVKGSSNTNSPQKSNSKNATQPTAAQNSDSSDNTKTSKTGDSSNSQPQPAQNSDLAAYVASLAQPAPVQPAVNPATATATAAVAPGAVANAQPVAGSAASLAANMQANIATTSALPTPTVVNSKESTTSKFGDLMANENDKFGKLNLKDSKTGELKNNPNDFTAADNRFSATANIDADPQTLKQLAIDAVQTPPNNALSTNNPAAPIQFSTMLNGVAANSDSDKLTPKLGSADWDQAVGQKVVWMVAGGKQTAELTLNPPDLGPLRIVVSVNNDQASTTFVTSHPDVKNALEAAFPKLQQMMSDSGVQLSGFSVNTQSSNQSQPQFEQPKNRQSDTNSSGSSAAKESGIITNTSRINKNLGMVDTFA